MARVLIVAFKNFAYDSRTQRHAEALVERGDEVDVLCTSDGQVRARPGINLIGVRMPRYRGSHKISYVRSYLRFFMIASWTTLRRSIRRRYDLVLVSSMPDALVLCALPARLFGSKVVLDIRDMMPELYCEKFGSGADELGPRLLFAEERISAWFSHHVLAVHEPHRRRLEEAGIPARKISIVMNSPDPGIFDLNDGNGHFHAHENGLARPTNGREPFMLVYHGTLTRRLGLDVAIRAIGLLADRIPQLCLMILGVDDDDCLTGLKSLAAELKLNDRVTFAGPVAVRDLPATLSQATVGLVPNRATEATQFMLPVKLLEYAMMGIPVIAARLATIEYYFDETSVRFFKPEDTEDLAAAIKELYENPAKRADLARRAAIIAQKLSWGRHKYDYYRAIDTAAGGTAL
ncbi:MAG: glycosyltransferase family 4 protein [Candidatus Binataceae bacterium]|nr:glycosyltransferase family 4 protein [Candidatus Binataceae bacterium]